MTARVVTFYSYKGGVGRSFALANIAVILAQWGARVLAVDWDIEAPGLVHYFAGSQPARGVLDFLNDCQRDEVNGYGVYKSSYSLPGGEGVVDLMPAAGTQSLDYRKLVQGLDWDKLYDNHNLGSRLEDMREQWNRAYDVVLVDSRTGITDFSGLTTAQLPDILAFLFTANGQSLDGCVDVVNRAMEARRRMPVDRSALLPLPIPARFDQREEYERAQQWRTRFATAVTPFMDIWRPRDTDAAKLLDLLTIPYQARWTFGEDLAAVQELAGSSGTRSASYSVTYALETLAALLVQGLAKVDLLASSRDEYVHAARSVARSWRSRGRAAPKVFISYALPDRRIAEQIAKMLQLADFEPWIDAKTLDPGEDFESSISNAIEDSDGYVVVIAERSRGQQREIESMLRHRLRSEKQLPIVPVIPSGRQDALTTSRLSDVVAVHLAENTPVEVGIQPVLARLEPLRFGDRQHSGDFSPTSTADHGPDAKS
jgi:hypothetical protein